MIPMMRTLSTGEGSLSPVLSQPGWWRRDIRHAYPTMDARSLGVEPTAPAVLKGAAAPVLITGRTGTLGRFTAEACEHRALDPLLTDRRRMRIDDPASVAEALDAIKPWAVVNTAGWVRVDDAEDDPAGCMAANADGAAVLAEACAERGIRLVTFSSDLVFDGRNARPYVESDTPNPLNVYGRSKAEAERRVLAAGGEPLVVRTAAFFSASDPHNFAVWAARELAAGRTVRAAGDCTVSPTFVPDLVRAALDLLIDGETGIRHLANGGAVTWAEFAVQVAEALGLDAGRVQAVPASAMGWKATRPANAALGTERGQILPSFEAALERFAHDFQPELEIAPSPPARLRKPAARSRPTVN
jgi:dTDP-4-dehydrorhamnose reductase